MRLRRARFDDRRDRHYRFLDCHAPRVELRVEQKWIRPEVVVVALHVSLPLIVHPPRTHRRLIATDTVALHDARQTRALILPPEHCIHVNNMSPKQKRSYSSPLRQQQAATTRERIIAAALDVLTAHPAAELSNESVGRAARIATRTVYRHFPTRTDLLDAVWEEIDSRLGLSQLPSTDSAALLDFVPELFARLDANAPVVNALITSNAGHEMSRRTGERRSRAIESALTHETRNMTRAERDRLTALVRVLTSPMTWHVLRQKTRVTGNEPALAVTWALRRLIGVRESESRDKS